ncbi:MAG: nucleoside triphosphate pyrophosphohydrolase [Hyphomicrobiaceae bacterium]
MTTDAPTKSLADLLAVMAALRTPGTGCPWDLVQTFETIAPYTIEEAYEVADAIARADMPDLKDELGDLLLQVVYHSRIAEEAGHFAFADVAGAVTRKMIRRHPHVFGTSQQRSEGASPGFWESIKAEERAEKAIERAKESEGQGARPLDPIAQGKASFRTGGQGDSGLQSLASQTSPRAFTSLLADVPIALPGMTRAIKLQDKAARVGFDWPDITPVFAKIREEAAELEEAVATQSRAEIEGEFGDLLFVMANLARHLKIDPEAALRITNAKFTRRFHHIEEALATSGRSPAQSDLAEMDRLWNDAKAKEK